MHVVAPSVLLGILALCLVVPLLLRRKGSPRPLNELPPPLPGKTRGRVKSFNPIRAYGWIGPLKDPDTNVYVHTSAVERAGYARLYEGDIVDYVVVSARTGQRCAEQLDLIQRQR